MAKFEKFDAGKQLLGLTQAVWQIAREERASQKSDKDVEFNFGANVTQEGPKRVQ